MALLSKDQILGADDIKTVEVEVPEWGGSVTVQMMSGTARDALQELLAKRKASSAFEAVLIVSTVVDANGAPLFTEDDVPALRAKSTAALQRVSSAAMKLNRMGADAVKESEKNSEAAPSGDSGTA